MAVGKSIPMLDSVARVTGTLPYAANLKLPEMLVAKVLRSPVPHARLVRLDASAAEHLPGVVAVVTAADFDQADPPKKFYGVHLNDQPLLAADRVRYIGEPLALVAAETAEIAEAALALIEVEVDELPAVYEAEAATEPGAPVLHEAYPDNRFVHARLRHGDLEAGFAGADEIIEETFSSPVAQHASLEPHVTVARWHDGQLTVWTATQAPYLVQRVLAELFDLGPEAVRVIVPPLGGGYGGKGHIRIEPITSALAWKVGGRPVKLALTPAEPFVTATKHEATITIKTGVKRDGTFTARQLTLFWNAGAYADASPALVRTGMVRAVGPYRIPAVRVDSYGVYTNLPPACAFRGAMSSQGTWAYESHLDTIARRLELDPLELRLKNVLRSGQTFCTGETMHDVHFVDCLQTVADGLGWQAPKRDQVSGPVRRGRGIAVMMKSTIPSSKSECRLVLNREGRVTLYTSTVEMGQGAHTALAQITAEAVGLPVEQIDVVGPDTALTPFDSTTSASRGTNMMGGAIVDGADKLVRRLLDLATPIFEQAPEALANDAGYVFSADEPEQRHSYADVLRRNDLETLEASGEYETKAGLDPETGQGVTSHHWHQGAGACEVEVDTETGQVRLLRYHAAAYAGRVVNPRLAQLQNDGNVVYGLGQALYEKMVFDHGQVVNANLSDYMVPSFLDVPPELESAALEAEGGEIHGLGEMTLPPVAPAIANAIYDAVGVRIRDLPISAESVLRALLKKDGD